MTITSNIHYNLAAWTNHTFALGERCSNSGQAYQCITSGTSTVAPTGVAADSAPGGTVHFKWLSAINFTNLQSWYAALPATFSDHNDALLWNNGEITVAPGVSLLTTGDGNKTTNGFITTIKPAAGESFRDKVSTTPLAYNAANGVAFRVTGASGGAAQTTFFIGNGFFRIDGIQFKCDAPSATSMINANQSADGFDFTNNIVDFFAQNGATWAMDVDCIAGIFNNLFIDRQAAGDGAPLCLFGFSGLTSQFFTTNTVIAINSPATGFGVEFLGTGTSNLLVRNCAFFGYNQPLKSAPTSGAITIDHCCTNVALFATCTDNGAQQFSKLATNQFVSTTTDFRTKAGSSCLDTGVTDLLHLEEANDVYRTARPQNAAWDIGAYELAAGLTATGTAAGIGTAQGITGNAVTARGAAAGIGTATGLTPNAGVAAGSAIGIGTATGVPPVVTGVSTLGTIVTIDTTNCVSVTPVRLSTTIDPPPYRLRLAYQHNHTVQTSDLNATVAATRIQFLQSPDTYASWSSNTILQRYRRPNDPAPFGGGLLVLSEAQIVVNELGDLFGGRSRLYDAVVPVAVGLAIDLGDPINLVYPMDDLRNGRYGQVVGEQFRSGDATLTLRILVTTDSRFVGPGVPGLVGVV